MNKSNMEFLITSVINSLIIFVICFYVLFNKEPVVYNETNTYVQYIEGSERIEDNLPIHRRCRIEGAGGGQSPEQGGLSDAVASHRAAREAD